MDDLAAHGDVENRICQGEIHPNKLLEFLLFSPKTLPLILLISTRYCGIALMHEYKVYL